MDSCCCKVSPIISAFVFFLFFISSVCPAQSVNFNNINHKSKKLKYIIDYLKKINKPAVKTIQSSDGDLIDCVLSDQQPAFDHPLLKGQKQMDPPVMPKGPISRNDTFEEEIQVWRMSGESCPENTIPIRRTTEEDVQRASSVRTFGRKTVRRDSLGDGHEHAIGYVQGDAYYGAQAIINVWAPHVEEGEFSISQIWVMAGSFDIDLNTVEVGWQVNPGLYGDALPRLFIYWTSDSYKHGCYNLLCPGFVQKSDKIIPGAAFRPTSSYRGKQFDNTFVVLKDPNNGNWWLKINGQSVGYWPSVLFTHLKTGPADMVQFGGEILNSKRSEHHTTTEMGSGHFPQEGYGKAAYLRNIQVVNSKNTLIPAPKLLGYFEKPNCYIAGTGTRSKTWGNYIFYGGPGGTAPRCTN